MKFSLKISAALLLVLTSATIAATTEEIYKIPISRVYGPVRPSTVGRWTQTLRKYGITARSPGITTSKGPHSHGRIEDTTNLARIPLVDYDFDREYYGTVMIGEPPQAFKIDFDTGSSQFVISAKDCEECSGATHYDPKMSTTFQATKASKPLHPSSSSSLTAPHDKSSSSLYGDNPQPWHITYGDQSFAEGYLGRDRITLDGIQVQHQQLALVTNESTGFDDTIDGIMGLAFGALSTSIASTKTVFENMMAQKLVRQGVFSFYLGKSSLNGGGEVIFGGMDLDRVEPGHTLTFTPVTKPKYWQINIGNIFVNGQVVRPGGGGNDDEDGGEGRGGGHKKGKANLAGIMDTGTTLLVVPTKWAKAIHRKIRGSQELGSSWTVPCNLAIKATKGNKVEIEIEGKRFGIPFEDLVREETGEQPGRCYSGIQTSSASFMIIGDVFIKNNYIVFDQEKKRVGIAPLKLERRKTETASLQAEASSNGVSDKSPPPSRRWEVQEESSDVDYSVSYDDSELVK
ncbi:hypothetical protein EMPS_02600 [Entomortierella parvispora]|uniref:Peptidase A1 domain-containing protein n=1 Tax=Entomortierella parvispora TaxID=205924 RepID=A0A9P3H513_9FUNG|nr:hypothetical protein EMPS_02600 [Entomortierella parvispora]